MEEVGVVVVEEDVAEVEGDSHVYLKHLAI